MMNNRKFSQLAFRLQCLLVGYNYEIVCESSEITVKLVKKYAGAIMIVVVLWTTIGFVFATRYLMLGVFGAVLCGLLMALIVLQIERQIILTFVQNIRKKLIVFLARVVIAVVMAFLGAVILDQIIFKEDIEKRKIERVQNEVNRLMPLRTEDISRQIQELEQAIEKKEQELSKITASSRKGALVAETETTVRTQRGVVRTQKSSPKINPLMIQLEEQIKDLRDRKLEKENEKLRLRQSLEEEIKARVGFIDELETLKDLISSSWSAFTVWLALFLLFFFIEVLVLIFKLLEDDSDYRSIIEYQRDYRIAELKKMRENNAIS
jgi:hypothetical protein